jgi:hypothetical protein
MAAAVLVGLTVREFIQRRIGRTVLAAIDHSDELVAETGPRQAHRRRFLDELDEALRAGGLHLLVVAHEEAVGWMADVLGNGVRHDIAALTWQGAVDAVSEPMTAVGRPFADGVADRLVTDLQTSRIGGADGSERHVSMITLNRRSSRSSVLSSGIRSLTWISSQPGTSARTGMRTPR